MDKPLEIKYQYMHMNCSSKQYWYGKGGTTVHIMKDLITPGGGRCGVIKMLMGIYQFIQYEIYYSVKYKRTNVGSPFLITINSVESNISFSYI